MSNQELPPDRTRFLPDAVYSSSASWLRAYSTLVFMFLRLDEVFLCMIENNRKVLLLVCMAVIFYIHPPPSLWWWRTTGSCMSVCVRAPPCGQEVNSRCDSSQARRQGTTSVLHLKPDRAALWRLRWVEGEVVLGFCTAGYSSARLCCSWPVNGGTTVT